MYLSISYHMVFEGRYLRRDPTIDLLPPSFPFALNFLVKIVFRSMDVLRCDNHDVWQKASQPINSFIPSIRQQRNHCTVRLRGTGLLFLRRVEPKPKTPNI